MGPFNSLNSDDSCSYICQDGRRRRRRRRRWRRRLLDSPYIINDIISTTLLTKQMHKSRRPESIDRETFNHVLNDDYCSHNAIIIFSCWSEWICCQSERKREAAAIREAELWLTATRGKKGKWAAASLCGVAGEKWLSKNAVDICCFVYQLAGAE